MFSDVDRTQDITQRFRPAVAGVMQIQDMTLGKSEGYAAKFRGRLVVDSMEAYARVSEAFRALNHTALFRREDGLDVVLAVSGTIPVRQSRTWVNALLFVLTILSVVVTGGLLEYQGQINSASDFFAAALQGVPFAVAMLSILGAHELGHYFAARYHKVAVTLPYFIPMPFISPFGTMGAFIQLKSPPTNKRVLLDIGLAGPLAGFVVAVPVLIYGLATSPLQQIPTNDVFGMEGNSILYVLAKFLIFGKLLPEPVSFGGLPPLLYMLRFYVLGIPSPAGGQDVFLNSVAWAGWAGLLVTGLNLIPAGQLDGGHLLYVLIGKRMRSLLPVLLVILVGLGFFWSGWFFWVFLLMMLGRTYAAPLDQITPLDPTRRALAILGLAIFVLVFTPIPLRQFGG